MVPARDGIGFGVVVVTLTLLFPGSAAALSRTSVLQAGSTITLGAGLPQPLTGGLERSFTGACVTPFDPGNCILRYDLAELALIGGGEIVARLSFHAVAVPEPASSLLLAPSLGVLGAREFRRRRISGLRV